VVGALSNSAKLAAALDHLPIPAIEKLDFEKVNPNQEITVQTHQVSWFREKPAVQK
jgi:hypothetical protein